jgi:ligand-binding sensor domain-containing protein
MCFTKPANRCGRYLKDSHFNLWVGTEGGGLILFDRKTGHVAVRYSTEEGLTNNAVLNILKMQRGIYG